MPGWNYLEARDQPRLPNNGQRRWVCDGCGREFLFALQLDQRPIPQAEDWDHSKCPHCGSPEVRQIAFEGLFDSATDYGRVAQVMAGVSVEQLAGEQRLRERQVGGCDTSETPAPLVAEAWPPRWTEGGDA